MASRDDIDDLFGWLEAAGCRKPPAIRTDADRTADVWVEVLADVPRDALKAAAIAYVRRPPSDRGSTAAWWPAPGDLIALLPQSQGTRQAMDDADRWWGYVREAQRTHNTASLLQGSEGDEWTPRGPRPPAPERPDTWSMPLAAALAAKMRYAAELRAMPAEDRRALERWEARADEWILHQDPRVRHALEETIRGMGGWRDLCRIEDDVALAAARKSFRDAWRATIAASTRRRELRTVEALAAGERVPPERRIEGARSGVGRPFSRPQLVEVVDEEKAFRDDLAARVRRREITPEQSIEMLRDHRKSRNSA